MNVSRKRVLVNLISFPVAAVVLAAPRAASADPTIDQSTAHYQDQPNNGQSCSGCTQFVPSSSNPGSDSGTCKTVKGTINPHGWCQFFTAKS